VASGFLRRRRCLSGATFVQTLTFGWLANPHAPLDELAELADELGCPLSPQALDQRFTPQAAACLARVLNAALLRLVAACPVAAPLLRRFTGVYVRDCSTITLPTELADWLPGCGHSRPRQVSAGLKLHVGLELTTGALEGLELQPARTSDRSCAGSHTPLPDGALLLEDLGFFDVPRMRHYAEQGAFVLSRAPARLLITAPGRRRQNIDAFVAGLTGTRFDGWVTIGRRHRAWRCRLLAVRVPPEVEQQRRERAQQEARKLGRPLSQRRLTMCGWTVLLTNAPETLLSLEEALALRRVRWQIELLFRVWKDEGRVDESRGRKPYRVLCEVLAKLLGQLVQHWTMLLAGSPLEWSGAKSAQRVRRRATRLVELLGQREMLIGLLERLQERLRRFTRKRGRPGRPTTLELVNAAVREGERPPPGAEKPLCPEGENPLCPEGDEGFSPPLPKEDRAA
jgi:hypothetical protein